MAGIVDTGRQLDDAALGLLKSCIGQQLVSYEAYCPFDASNIYASARLTFDKASLRISNRHEPIVLGADYTEEELAVLSVLPDDGAPLWHPAGKELSTVSLDLLVEDVLVVVDTMLLSRGSRLINKLVLVQAIAFETHLDGSGEPDSLELVAFDRDIWSDEYLNVRRGPKISAVTRDHRADYIAEPPFAYRFGRTVMRLSSGH